MKKPIKIALWTLGIAIASPVLLYLAFAISYWVECSFPIKSKYETLDAGADRRVEILTDMIDIDYAETYIRVRDKGKTVVPVTRFGGLGNYPRHYALVIGTNNAVVGVVEKGYAESNVLALVDFKTQEFWVSTSTTAQSRAQGTALLQQLKQDTGKQSIVLGANGNW